MTIELIDKSNRRARKRINRHGYEYDFILEHQIKSNPAPMGVLLKSRKTGRYTWFNRLTINMPFYDGDLIPTILEGVQTYTDNKQLVYNYLDHLMKNVLSKRDCKRYGPIYETVKIDQLSLVDRLNS